MCVTYLEYNNTLWIILTISIYPLIYLKVWPYLQDWPLVKSCGSNVCERSGNSCLEESLAKKVCESAKKFIFMITFRLWCQRITIYGCKQSIQLLLSNQPTMYLPAKILLTKLYLSFSLKYIFFLISFTDIYRQSPIFV